MPETGNIIKPAKLIRINEEAGPSNAPPHFTNEIPPNTQTNSLNQALADQITALVADVIKREGRIILSSLLNPESDINYDVDQRIVSTDSNLSDMDKIPDVVKSLREFSGKPGEFGSWKKSVDRILTIYEPLKGTAKYYGILSVIRNKIVGHADIALESYNTPLNWEKISRCLTLHYADKRDLGTLEYQMTTLVQGRSTIPEFYQEVYQHLSLILNKLCSMNLSPESLNIMTQSYRDKALDTFVRGLRGELPRLLSVKEPADLPQALHLCLKLENIDFRTQYAHNINNNRRNLPPPIPPRRNIPPLQRNSPIPAPRTNFYPELINYPQRNQSIHFQPRPSQQSYQHQSYPYKPSYPRQFPPKPLPRPEPMDVDKSVNSRAVNYLNHPRPQFVQKRPLSKQTHFPHKQQRIFNIEPENPETATQIQNYEQQIINEDANHDQTLTDYNEMAENATLAAPEQIDDIYFLD